MPKVLGSQALLSRHVVWLQTLPRPPPRSLNPPALSLSSSSVSDRRLFYSHGVARPVAIHIHHFLRLVGPDFVGRFNTCPFSWRCFLRSKCPQALLQSASSPQPLTIADAQSCCTLLRTQVTERLPLGGDWRCKGFGPTTETNSN